MSITQARDQANLGRFRDALETLKRTTSQAHDDAETTLFRLELLEWVAEYDPALSLSKHLLTKADISKRGHALCEYVIGRIDFCRGNIQGSIKHFQRSIELAKAAGDLERLCWSQLQLLLRVADCSGPNAAAPILAETRRNVARLGDSRVAAALHVFTAQIAAQMGQYESARRHTERALRLLSSAPNLWLEGTSELNCLATAIVSSDLDLARSHGVRALDLARASGVVSLERNCLINLSHLAFATGDFDEALLYSERARETGLPVGDQRDADLDNIARVRLAQGRLKECEELLDEISVHATGHGYVYRQSLLTRAQLLEHTQRWHEALKLVCEIGRLSAATGDQLLENTALLMETESRLQLGHIDQGLNLFVTSVCRLSSTPLHLYADYERLLATWLASSGRMTEARTHLERARRVCLSLRSAPALTDLERRWQQVTFRMDADAATAEEHAGADGTGAQAAVQAIGALLQVAERAELAGHELLQLVARTGCATHATLTATAKDGTRTRLASLPSDEPEPSGAAAERLTLADANGERRIDVQIACRPDPQSIATLGALHTIVQSLQRLDRARAREQAEAALWPIGESGADDVLAPVLSGRMAELVTAARRAGMADLCVLITGESGTGKEVLAREVHAHSTRANRTFLPFNCSTVPRDMLDSQLFGYRRGAFTGAHHDFPGVIRGADGGTLFLDEIAELGFDLQPKLLRFLESAEICPLGESRPFSVDVRVIAATNANLEQLVEDGRFREDLFYRLNVIRLRIPPLRERREEIPSLVQQFVEQTARRTRKGRVRIADETIEHIMLYHWPGNIRQLQNEVRRMVALADPDAVLLPDALSEGIVRERRPPAPTAPPPALQPTGRLKPALEKIEREMIKAALDAHRGDLAEAARTLGLSRKGLYLKRQRFDL